MALSIDVKLPGDEQPIFPDRCVSCGDVPAEGKLQIRTRSLGFHSLVGFFHFLASFAGRRVEVDIPFCNSCKVHFKWRRRLRTLLGSVSVAVGIAMAIWLLDETPYSRTPRRLIVLGIIVVCLLPVILWELLSPPPVEVTAYSKTVTYEFRDRDYAEEFASLNQGEIG